MGTLLRGNGSELILIFSMFNFNYASDLQSDGRLERKYKLIIKLFVYFALLCCGYVRFIINLNSN